jgi:peptide deformylase
MASDSSKPSRSPLPPPGSRVDPAALDIVIYPAEVLRKKAKPIDMTDPEVRRNVRAVADRMVELMHDAEGIGLAAPQVGLPWRMFVVDIPPAEPGDADLDPAICTNGPVVYINPVLSSPRGDLEPYEEGCLSLPKVRGDVIRPTDINIAALDLEGRSFSQQGTDLLARCWQHEYDHIDGVLILDKLTQSARLKNRAAIRDLEKNAGVR